MFNKILIGLLLLQLFLGCKPETITPYQKKHTTHKDPLLYGKWKKIDADSNAEYVIFKDSAQTCCILNLNLKNGFKYKEYGYFYIDTNYVLEFLFGWRRGKYKISNDSLIMFDANKAIKYIYVRNNDSIANENEFIKKIRIEKSFILYSRGGFNDYTFAVDDNYIYPSSSGKIYKVNINDPPHFDSFDIDFNYAVDNFCSFQYNGKFLFAFNEPNYTTSSLYYSLSYNGIRKLLLDLNKMRIKSISYDEKKDLYYIYDMENCMLYTMQNSILTPFFNLGKIPNLRVSDIVFLKEDEFLFSDDVNLYKIKLENNVYWYLECFQGIPKNSYNSGTFINQISINNNNLWISRDYGNDGSCEFFKINLD